LVLADAWKAAQVSQAPVLLFVTSDHCYYCKKMVAETYENPELAPLFARLFETATVKQADDPKLVEKLGVRVFPTTLVISPSGKLLGRMEGHVAPAQIGKRLNPILISYRKSLAAASQTPSVAANRLHHQVEGKRVESR